MTPRERQTTEASASYQIASPDFCGVVIAHHEAFMAGARWSDANPVHTISPASSLADRLVVTAVGEDPEITRLTSRIEKLRGALEFYANRAHWSTHDDEILFNNITDADWEKTNGYFSGGNTARKALADDEGGG